MNKDDIDYIHSCGPDCQRPICVLVRKAVEAEREACAKVAEANAVDMEDEYVCDKIAAAIRARSNT